MRPKKERPEFQSEARFSVQLYWASHSSLLIRAVSAAPGGGHLDLMFYGVSYMEIPQELWGVRLDDPTPEEVRHVTERMWRYEEIFDPRNVHVLVSEGRRYFIVASEVHVKEQPPGYHGNSLGE